MRAATGGEGASGLRQTYVLLFLSKQGGDVVQGFARAVCVVTVFVDQAFFDDGNLLLRFLVRPRCRAAKAQYFPALLEEVLADGVVLQGMAVQRELVAALERAHGLANYFLPEGLLARVRDIDLLFDRTQKTLVGLAFF